LGDNKFDSQSVQPSLLHLTSERRQSFNWRAKTEPLTSTCTNDSMAKKLRALTLTPELVDD
jgi:hypothetical protein